MPTDISIVSTPVLHKSTTSKPDDHRAAIQRIKNDVAIHLIDEWLADESGYDETIWDALKQKIEENRLSDRRHFADDANYA